MWFRTPPKPVDALITFLMSLVFQGAILTIKLSVISELKHDTTLGGRHFFFHSLATFFAMFLSFLLLVGGCVKLLMVKKEEKYRFPKVMRWNYGLMLFIISIFIMEIVQIVRILKYWDAI